MVLSEDCKCVSIWVVFLTLAFFCLRQWSEGNRAISAGRGIPEVKFYSSTYEWGSTVLFCKFLRPLFFCVLVANFSLLITVKALKSKHCYAT